MTDASHQLPPTMLAAVCRRYGAPDTLTIETMPTPQPRPTEILVATRATTVNSGDARLRAARFPRGFGMLGRLAFGTRGPRHRVLGTELAGTVVATGSAVTAYNIGDDVIVAADTAMGCHAQYRCIDQKRAIAAMPPSLSHAEASAIGFGGTTSLTFTRRAGVAAGQRVLVIGASGAVGLAAVQLCAHAGATVTAVCSAANADLVRSHGASEVVDYTTTDIFDPRASERAAVGSFDVLIDTVGHASHRRCRHLLNDRARLALVAATLGQMLGAVLPRRRGVRVLGGPAKVTADDLRLLASLAADGIVRPHIDRRYPFEQIVEAHRYVDTGRKRGSVVLTLDTP